MITAIPTTWTALEAALRERQPVSVAYHGRERVLCLHALGWSNGRALLLGYQVGGETSTGSLDTDRRKRWRCLFVDEIEQVVAEPGRTWESADNYNPAHPFSSIDEVAFAVPARGVHEAS